MQHSVSESMTTYSNEVEKQANTLGNTSTNGKILAFETGDSGSDSSWM